MLMEEAIKVARKGLNAAISKTVLLFTALFILIPPLYRPFIVIQV